MNEVKVLTGDAGHYVITNGPAFLVEFHLEGREYSYSFGPKRPIIFANEGEARMILALLCGLTAFDFDLDRSDWMVKKLVPVRPRITVKNVRKDWAKAFIRCRKAADQEGYIHCKECVNQGTHMCWYSNPPGCLEFCERFFSYYEDACDVRPCGGDANV